MNNNINLQNAKNTKDDEFYTTYECVEDELSHYTNHFYKKTVLCNCDDPFESNFCKYFLRYFNRLGLSRLICKSFASSCGARQSEAWRTACWSGVPKLP